MIIGWILIVIAAIELLSGVYVFMTRVKGHLVYSHTLVVLGVTSWVFANGAYRLTSSPETAFLWARLFYIGSILLTASFVYFTYVFPYAVRPLTRAVTLPLVLSAAYMIILISLSDQLIKSVSITLSGKELHYGTAYHIFLVWFFAMFIWGFSNLLQTLRTAAGVHHWQVKNIFLGVLLSFIFGSTFNLILPFLIHGTQWFYLGAGSSIFWLAFTTYMVFNRKAR